MDSVAADHVRNSRSLDLAIYGVLIVMGTLGISGLPSVAGRATAFALCVAFGLLNEFGPRFAQTQRHWALYFAAQTVIVVSLLALRSTTFDTFTFLFFMLSVQVMLMFPDTIATLWIVLFYVVSSAIIIWIEGVAGLFSVLFNAGVFAVCGVFGNTLRTTALAQRRNEALLEELRTAQQQVQELAITSERNRLARDLHDSVKQQVFATIMQLGAARVLLDKAPERAREHVMEAEQLAQQAGAELSLVIHELRPVALGEKGLAQALAAYASDWSRQSGVGVVTHVRGDYPVPAATEYALLRIAQEALANVARHSGAASVSLDLEYGADAVTLTIGDDGRGFDEQLIVAGVGLASMRERIEAIGGSLQVRSASDAGTTVTARWERIHD